MRTAIRTATLLSCAVAAGAQEPEPRHWTFFDSAETDAPPRLVVELEGGGVAEVVAEADTCLIGYLADRAWGALPSLSINLADTNRALIRFQVDTRWEVERAHLALSSHPSKMAPPRPFEVEIAPVEEPWHPSEICWNNQPAFGAASTVVELGVDDHLFEPDVTELVRAWASGERDNHGLLIRVHERLGPPPPEPTGEGPTFGAPSPPKPKQPSPPEQRLLGIYDWAPDVATARERAEERDAAVLAVVTADFGRVAVNEQERVLLSTALAHPRVREVIDERFVPVRIRVSPNTFALADSGHEPSPDPLAAIGAKLADVKPPALVRTDAEGVRVATARSLGTFDHDLVLDLLGEREPPSREGEVERGVALMREGRFDAAAPLLATADDDPRALYWRAAILHRRGADEEAFALLRAIGERAPDSPWAHKARARLDHPDLVRANESLRRPDVLPTFPAEVIEARALDHLIATQLPDGSWPVPDPVQGEARVGVTVLCLHALEASATPDAPLRGPIERAQGWLEARVAEADPARLNSFTATYWLDRVLRAGTGAEAEAAVELLLGGQMENGAWSYSKRWGEGWVGGFAGWPRTEKGRAHSMNSGIAMEALTRAAAAGVPVSEEALERGAEALLAMRRGPGAYTYTWPDPDIYGTPDASIARAPAAELALLRLGKIDGADARFAVETFFEHQHDLWVGAKMTGSWLPPHAYSGYFPFFGSYHAALVVRAMGGDTMERDLARLRADVLARVDPDGTWTDFSSLGKAYGTAMALLVLDVCELRPR